MNSAVCLLERSFELFPENKAVSDAAVTYTYAELRERARRAASTVSYTHLDVYKRQALHSG